VNDRIAPFLIDGQTTVLQAMRQLEDTAQKILFVVGADRALIGALTDGDIRRWILAGGGLEDGVDGVCNKEPFTVSPGYRLADVRSTMLDGTLGCVPVLDRRRRVADLLFWENVFRDGSEHKPPQPIDLPVVIMAGGKGTRLDPFTRVLPKPLIPLGDKTVIERIIDSFLRFGVDTFYLSVHAKSRIVKSYFEELQPPYTVKYVEESEPLGTAGALRYLQGAVQGSLIVTNCDIILDTDYAELVEFHELGANDITLVGSLRNFHIPYGICEIADGGELVRITEKPEYNFLVNTGMYVLRANALDLIPKDTFFHMTDLIDRVQVSGGRVAVYPVSDKAWLDTGEWAEYRKALRQFEAEE
jgi:dTDP-glucose pyrophosphorylase